MTGITGCDAHAPPRPFPQPVGRLTSSVIDHAAGNLFRTGRIGFIGFAPTLPTGGRSHHPPIGRWAPAVSACPSNKRRRGSSDTNRMVMASHREPPVGMESCRAVRGSRTRIISLEDRSADRCASTAKRESADTIF